MTYMKNLLSFFMAALSNVTTSKASNGDIVLAMKQDKKLGKEGYRLAIGKVSNFKVE